MSNHSRVHYMDNLRAFAMLLGIFFHAALAYSPMLNQIWLTADPQNSALVDLFAYFSHMFRMPLFFVIAGFFAALLVDKRGLPAMLKNRFMRITLPLMIFLPLIIISFVILISWSIEHVDNKSPMLGMIAMMAQNPEATAPPLTTTHLWFLYNLTFFYLLTGLVVRFVKFDWMRQVVKSPRLFILLGPLLLVPALTSQHAPIAAPEQFIPQLWSFGFYGLFYLLGWGLFKHESLLEQLRPYLWFMLFSSCVAYGGFSYLIPADTSLQDVMLKMSSAPVINATQLCLATLQAYVGVFMSISLLIIGRGIFNQQNTLMKLVADSSYWVYIIHLPVLWLIQFVLLDIQLPLVVEFSISVCGTLLIGLVSYLALVKWTPIGWLLNGRKNIK